MVSKARLEERISGHEALRHQQERWERDRRKEDREDRKIKDEELNGVRLQLRDQAATFVTRDTLAALERAYEARLDAMERNWEQKLATAIDRLNEQGTEGFRESSAVTAAREATTKEILGGIRQNQETVANNRRWMIGIAVTVAFGILANTFTLITMLAHILKIF